MNINILSEQQVSRLTQLISDSQRIVITCHKSPDGDALGASLSWAEYLRLKGKSPTICIPDAFPDFLQFIPLSGQIVRYDKHPDKVNQLLAEADLVFCLDYNSIDRLANMQDALGHSPAKRVLIDHHLNPVIPVSLTISKPNLSSTCELIFRIVWQLGDFELLTRNAVIPLYTGIMTDTGAFTYNSSQPELFFIVSQLLTKRFDKDRIYRNVYNNFSPWAIRFRGYLMSQKLNVLTDQHAAFFTITRQDMARFHFVKGDAEGLVNEPLRIKGVRLSISLREDTENPNLVWVSLRSVGQYHCNQLAEQFFQGGGHPNASGGKLQRPLSEAVEIVKQAIAHFAANS